MIFSEIEKLLEQIKLVSPVVKIPDLSKCVTNEEKIEKCAAYILAFGKLNYNITLKALQKIMVDEDKLKEFRSLPIPTLAKEATRLTEFTEDEKRSYEASKNCYFAVDTIERKMLAYNCGTHQREPQYDRPMNEIEKGFWIYYMTGEGRPVTYEEYEYYKRQNNLERHSYEVYKDVKEKIR